MAPLWHKLMKMQTQAATISMSVYLNLIISFHFIRQVKKNQIQIELIFNFGFAFIRIYYKYIIVVPYAVCHLQIGFGCVNYNVFDVQWALSMGSHLWIVLISFYFKNWMWASFVTVLWAHKLIKLKFYRLQGNPIKFYIFLFLNDIISDWVEIDWNLELKSNLS